MERCSKQTQIKSINQSLYCHISFDFLANICYTVYFLIGIASAFSHTAQVYDHLYLFCSQLQWVPRAQTKFYTRGNRRESQNNKWNKGNIHVGFFSQCWGKPYFTFLFLKCKKVIFALILKIDFHSTRHFNALIYFDFFYFFFFFCFYLIGNV